MKKHTRHWLTPQILTIAVLCMTASFGAGIRTAGDVQTVDHTEAEETLAIPGDMDASGSVDTQDVLLILEIVRGYASAAPAQLRNDPNGDGTITLDDAIQILRDIHLRTV